MKAHVIGPVLDELETDVVAAVDAIETGDDNTACAALAQAEKRLQALVSDLSGGAVTTQSPGLAALEVVAARIAATFPLASARAGVRAGRPALTVIKGGRDA